MKILKTGPYNMRKVKVKDDLFDALELSVISECDSDAVDKDQAEFESLPQDAKQDYVKIQVQKRFLAGIREQISTQVHEFKAAYITPKMTKEEMMDEIAKGLQLIDMINQKHGIGVEMKDPQLILNKIRDRKSNTTMEFMFRDLQKLFKKNEKQLDFKFDKLCQENSIGSYAGQIKNALGTALQKAMKREDPEATDVENEEANVQPRTNNFVII